MKKHLLITGYLFAATAYSFAQNTTITLQPGPLDGKDAEVFNCVPCGYDVRNFGNKKDLDAIAWTNSLNESNVRSLFQFDLSSIPAGATIVDARLSLYNYSGSAEGGHVSSSLATNSSKLQRITSAWDEHTVTWNTQPTATNLHQVLLPHTNSPNQNFLNINVTTLVQDMILHPTKSFGFRLKLRLEDEPRKLIFASSDNPDATIRPKIVITYFGPSPKLSNPGTSESKTEQSLSSNLSLEMSPNPVKDVVNISVVANENSPALLKIYNITGTEVYNQVLQLTNGFNQFPLQTQTWMKGIYFVSIKTSKEAITKKLIVE